LLGKPLQECFIGLGLQFGEHFLDEQPAGKGVGSGTVRSPHIKPKVFY